MSQDNDIDALFDAASNGLVESEAATSVDTLAPAPLAEESPVAAPESDRSPPDVFQRLGSLTRNLHDALRQLGYDQHIQQAVDSLPDARARLSYIADLTGRAADKVLSAVDDGMAAEDRIFARAQEIAAKLGTIQQPSLRAEAYAFALEVQSHSESTRARLTDIMMAQDFHDLTGQVINKVGDIAQSLEQQLVKLLLDMTPPEQRTTVKESVLEGPVIDQGRQDVVHNQEQVDDLLESLGF